MSHRLYLYNYCAETSEFSSYIGEWKYVVPLLFIPLLAEPKAKGKSLYFNKKIGVEQLTKFYSLLEQQLDLSQHHDFQEKRTKVLEYLNDLAFEHFYMDATDVFNMRDEPKKQQAKDFVEELQLNQHAFQQAIEANSLEPLNPVLESQFHFKSWLELLEHEYVDYGWYLLEVGHLMYPEVHIICEDEHYGLMNAKSKIILPAIYNDIQAFSYMGYAIVEKDQKFGVVYADGEICIKPEWDEIGEINDFEQKQAIVVRDGKLGLIDLLNEQILLPIDYEEIDFLYNGYLQVKKNGVFQVLDQSLSQIIENSNQPFELWSENFLTQPIAKSPYLKFYNRLGEYIGEFYPENLRELNHQYLLLKPFKKKAVFYQLYDSHGTLIFDDIEKIKYTSENSCIALQRNKVWMFYHCALQKSIEIEDILNIQDDYFHQHTALKDHYILTNIKNQYALYDALNDDYVFPFDMQILSIQYVSDDVFIIKDSLGHQYFKLSEHSFSDEKYDYICGFLQNDFYILAHKNDQLVHIDQTLNCEEMTNEQCAKLYLSRSYFEGEDLTYFERYVKNLEETQGFNYYQYLDDRQLSYLGMEEAENGNLDEAIKIYKIGVERQHAEMMCQLAYIYTENESVLNIDEAIQLYKKSADLGNANAQNNLGYHYMTGIGVQKDVARAIQLYSMSAAQNYALALQNLAFNYYNGEEVEQDLILALDYFKKAEKQGMSNPHEMIEIYYRIDDYKNAIKYLKKSKDEDFTHIYWGIFYQHGFGIDVNLEKSKKYYERSLEVGSYSAAYIALLEYYIKNGAFESEDDYVRVLALAQENEADLPEHVLPSKKSKGFFKRLFGQS